jgi:hypothetical protein
MVERKKKATVKKPEAIPVFASKERIAEVKNDIRELESMLKEDAQRKVPKITDVDGVKAEIFKKQQYIERHSPAQLRGENANRAFKEAKELERIIKEKMPKASVFGQHYPKGGDSHLKQQKFEEAVRQQMHFMSDPKVKQAAQKYKYIMARLSGGDPRESNIERLRSAR